MATRRHISEKEPLDLRAFLNEIKEDVKYKKFARVVATTQKRVDLEANRNEAIASHATRTSRQLHGKKQYSPKALLEASMNDLSVRARLVEIRVNVSIHIELLEEACDALRRYIFTQYREQMNEFQNEAQRKALIERVQGVALEIKTEGNSLLTTLDHIIKDIDQASHLLRNMVEMLKLIDSSKGKVI